MKPQIPISRTCLLDEEITSAVEVLRSGWLVQGPRVKEFEEKWSAFTDAKYSIAVTSCTSALHLSLAALGFGPGDEAIVPAFTWVSTANVVEHLGGRVVFCDIDLRTFNIDPVEVESKITPRTRAIIPVHLFGLAADMDPIMAIAKKHNLCVVEDAACGFGAKYHGQHVGTLGNTGCFSFHPRKAITTGEGGMVTTGSEQLAEKIRCLRDHGASVSEGRSCQTAGTQLLFDHIYAGYNQRMTDIQAALGSAQMSRGDSIISERRRLARRYDQKLNPVEWLKTPKLDAGFTHGYQSYCCLFQPEPFKSDTIARINVRRNAWMENLKHEGISTRPGTHAIHMLSFYQKKYGIMPERFPNARVAHECSVSLPLFSGMTEKEQDYVVEKVLASKI